MLYNVSSKMSKPQELEKKQIIGKKNKTLDDQEPIVPYQANHAINSVKCVLHKLNKKVLFAYIQ
jgi:hypothetical protein